MGPTRQLINSSGNHTVQICLTTISQIDLVTRYIKKGLRNGESIIVIVKPVLRKTLKLKMDALSFDGQPLIEPNQIRFFDAEYLLSYLKSDEGLEEEAFQENIAALINDTQSKYKKVRAFGKMVNILWEQGQHDMAIQLEDFWKRLTDTQELSFLCTYSLDQLDPESYDEVLERICKYHSHLAPQENYSSIEQGVGEAVLSAFGNTWNRVINKLADPQQTPVLA